MKWGALLVCLVLCLSAGAIGVMAGSGPSPWFDALRKPAWNPPNWLFGPVWTTLYILMAVSVWRVWLTPPMAGRTLALWLFAAQLAVNAGWSWAFFGAKSPLFGLVVILVLDVAVAMTFKVFKRLDLVAARLLIPYILWILFATALNAMIYELNK